MQGPPIRRSPGWSRSCPPIDIELRGSPRLAAAWLLWSAALAAALWFGCALPCWWRAPLVLLALASGWRGAALLRWPQGRRRGAAGAWLSWQPDGRWRLAAPGEPAAYVQPVRARLLGPLLWLGWRDRRGWRHAAIDLLAMEPNARAALKTRMGFHDGARPRSSR